MYDQDGDMELDFNEFQKLLQGKRVNNKRVLLRIECTEKNLLLRLRKKMTS